jgi:hypothetical protein
MAGRKEATCSNRNNRDIRSSSTSREADAVAGDAVRVEAKARRAVVHAAPASRS